MDIDDPRLVEAHKQMTKRVERYDERIVTVLKGSLSCEQVLNDLLKVANRRWKRRFFSGKVDIAEKLFCPELDAVFGPPLRPQMVFAMRLLTATRRGLSHSGRQTLKRHCSPGCRPSSVPASKE